MHRRTAVPAYSICVHSHSSQLKSQVQTRLPSFVKHASAAWFLLHGTIFLLHRSKGTQFVSDFTEAICGWYATCATKDGDRDELTAASSALAAVEDDPGRAEVRRIDPQDGKARTLVEPARIRKGGDSSYTSR